MAAEVWKFGDYTLDAPGRELRRGGETIELTPKVFDTLVHLVRNRHRVLTKDELLDALWPGQAVEEANVSQNVYVLRRTLGETGLIRTVARIGYRFVAPVASNDPGGAQPAAPPAPAPAAAGVPTTLALLPLVVPARLEYLAEGFVDGLRERLARAGLRVTARDSTLRFRDADPADAGRQLGVGAVLAGRIVEWGERIAVSLELVDVAGGWQLWGLREECPADRVQQLQAQIVRAVAQQLGGGVQAPRPPTPSIEAWDLCARGRFRLNQRTRHTPQQAIECFEAALEADPDYAPAHVGLADAWILMWLYGIQEPASIYPQARAAATRALELDPELADAHAAMGAVHMLYEWDWRAAQAALARAVQLNPGHAAAHFQCGLLEMALGDFAAARDAFRRAQALDPLSLVVRTFAGYPDYYGRAPAAACRAFREVLALEPRFSIAQFRLGLALIQAGDLEGGRAALLEASLAPGEKDVIAVLGWVDGRVGDSAGAQAAVDHLQREAAAGYVSGYQLALAHLGTGDREAALDQLERACEQRSYKLIWANHDPLLDELRAEPRFQAVLKRLALP